MWKKYVTMGIASVLLLTNIPGTVYADEGMIMLEEQPEEISDSTTEALAGDEFNELINKELQESAATDYEEICKEPSEGSENLIPEKIVIEEIQGQKNQVQEDEKSPYEEQEIDTANEDGQDSEDTDIAQDETYLEAISSLESAPEEQSDTSDEQLAEAEYLPYEGAKYRLRYQVEEGLIAIVGIAADDWDADLGQLVIPAEIDGKTVIKIAEGTCTGCTFSGELVIPESVRTIESRAFSNTNFRNLVINRNTIPQGAFDGCHFAGSLELTEYVRTIESGAFAHCNMEGDLIISPNMFMIGNGAFNNSTIHNLIIGMTDIRQGAFDSCEVTGTLTLEEGVKLIESRAFANCKIISSGDLVIPSSISAIGEAAFAGCSFGNLVIRAKNIPDNFCYWETYSGLAGWAFRDCSFAGKLVLQDGVVNIGKGAFENCPLVNGELVLPNSVVNIGERAFDNCTGLTAVKIPDSVKKIGDRAFSNCSGLRNIEIPASVEEIGTEAFVGNSPDMPKYITVLGRNTAISGNALSSYYCSNFIYGYRDSTAENHAKENWATFVPLDVPEVTEHRVTTSWELLDAIDSYQHIILADGIYEIPDSLRLNRIVSLAIEAENPGKAEILSKSTVVPVVVISRCMGIELRGCILGHESVEDNSNECGSSEAYVVSGSNSVDVKINNSDLYGCGTEGGSFSYCENVSIENCVIRDCMRRIASASMTENLNITNCMISGNAYDEELARTYEALALYESNVSFKNSLFVNNYNTKFDGDLYNPDEKRYELQTTACSFYNNAWDGETPGTYGICLNGITWQLDGGTLKIGYPLQLGTDKVVQSEKGSVLPYSDSSLPWKNCSYQQVDVAEGVEYDRGNGVTVNTSGADIEVAVPMTSEEYKSLLSGILTQEEMQAVEEGKSAEVEIVVADGETAVPEKDKQTIENTALDECYAVGKYLDITMYIQVGNNNKRAVEQTTSPLRLVLEIPEELRNGKYNFAVMRMHNKKVDLLTDLDENPSTVTIETDLFSTYALVYGAAEGITGVVSGFGAEDEKMLIRVVGSDGAVVAETQAAGGKTLYMLENVPAGSYTLRVEKKNHVSRDYPVTITAGRAAIQNIELWLIGDVDGNGRVNARDKKLIYNHIAGDSQLTDYAFSVGDVDGNGRINAKDSKMIYNHIAGMTLLWE